MHLMRKHAVAARSAIDTTTDSSQAKPAVTIRAETLPDQPHSDQLKSGKKPAYREFVPFDGTAPPSGDRTADPSGGDLNTV